MQETTQWLAQLSQATDHTDLLQQRAREIEEAGGGTLALPDGIYHLARPLLLPGTVSLTMTPAARLRAMETFCGDAVLVKERIGESGQHAYYGSIRGGIIDGGKLPVTGIAVPSACRLDIRDVEVVNARMKGIDIGAEGWYEVNVSNVRCSLDPEVAHLPGSIGLHYQKCTDSLVSGVIIIGYETGLRSDSSSNDIQLVHVWNFPGNGPLKYCFYCNGWNDSYHQCYADSPFDGDNPAYGFYVARPFNRIVSGRIYCNDFATDGRAIGIFIEPGATHGSYLANHFTAREGHRIGAAFAGNLDAATILGNSFAPTVIDGLVCQLPSGGGGESRMPELKIVKGE